MINSKEKCVGLQLFEMIRLIRDLNIMKTLNDCLIKVKFCVLTYFIFC